MRPKRSHKQDKLAKLYDSEILPIWAQRFGRLLLRDLVLPPKANVLDVGCGTGYPALDVLRRMDDHGRIIAIDSSSAMLDAARDKAGPLSGKRIFFRSESAEPKLTFANDVYDLVLSNLALAELEDPIGAVKEFARVTKPGGRVVVTLPLAGTFGEFYDIFREVLIKRDKTDALDRLDTWLLHQPTPEAARIWFERADLSDITLEEERFTVLFKSSREFFFAPLIEYGDLGRWKEIAGKGPEMQDIFWHIKESIDAYFGGSSFNVTVVAGCVRARKPGLDEPIELRLPRPVPLPPEGARPEAALRDLRAHEGEADADEPSGETSTNQIVLGSDQLEIVEETDAEPIDDDDLPPLK